MKNKILTLLIGAIIGGTICCTSAKANVQPKTDYEKAIEQIIKADETGWADKASGYSDKASAHLLKVIYEEQKKQTDILQKILNNTQK